MSEDLGKELKESLGVPQGQIKESAKRGFDINGISQMLTAKMTAHEAAAENARHRDQEVATTSTVSKTTISRKGQNGQQMGG